ncbi:UNVERIFIED_CONTAM: hypothetical protein K2H54_033178 [Gekko kuhli]
MSAPNSSWENGALSAGWPHGLSLLSPPARSQDPGQRRILDRATRQRRLNRQLEALENDNFQDDPHANMPQLVKRLPQFDDDAETGKKKKKTRGDHFKLRFRKNFQALLEEQASASLPVSHSSLLHCLRLPFELHLRVLRGPLLLREVLGNASRDQVSEVDSLTCVLRNCRLLACMWSVVEGYLLPVDPLSRREPSVCPIELKCDRPGSECRVRITCLVLIFHKHLSNKNKVFIKFYVWDFAHLLRHLEHFVLQVEYVCSFSYS